MQTTSKPSIYIINPKADFPPYYGAEVMADFGYQPAAFIADLAITTLAALIPNDFDIHLVDQQISEVDIGFNADFICLTGKSSQIGNMIKLAKAFKQRGKTVLIGGPYASLTPEAVRQYCDILVTGEIEEIANKLFADLLDGQWQTEYNGSRVNILKSPVPRWDLYPNQKAMQGCVQTSRGCPFECEFCDVIEYVGRKQRHKSVEQVLAELDLLYQHGYRNIFLADDNFTVYRRRTKLLLRAIRDWNNEQQQGRVFFSTQISIDASRDKEILQLCFEAGLHNVFIGIETPNEESLKETGKRQNVGIDLVEQIKIFSKYGMNVMGGMIVGFDADEVDIFQRQYDFAMSTPIPIFTIGALVAPAATRLFKRLYKDQRLIGENDVGASITPWHSNIIPVKMSREDLMQGLHWLSNRIYSPEAFEYRMLNFIDLLQQPAELPISANHYQRRSVDFDRAKLIRKITNLGKPEKRMFSHIMKAAMKKPASQRHVISNLFMYMQIRHMYQQGQFWEPLLAQQSEPNLSVSVGMPSQTSNTQASIKL